ncbi:MAG: ABC transporter permease [Bacteroidales bacterium]|nr:ABC transporter permease [Bacteroidales bacterium]
MNVPLFIAKRYLFSKKNRNAINIISGISILVVAVSTAALIIVLSSINGFGKLIDEQISTYAPDLKIEIKKGKTFSADDPNIKKISQTEGISYIAEVIEDNILLKHKEKQLICTVKGVPENYGEVFGLDTAITFGLYKTHGNSLNFAVLGAGVSYNLGISVESGESISLWIPNRKSIQILNPEQSFNIINLIPAGVISIDAEFDTKYIISSLETIRKFTDRDSVTVSSIEIKIKNPSDIQEIKKDIKNILGNNYYVKDIYDQFDVYKIMKSERLAAFIIMLFIILIASFSIIGSVTMLIIEKQKDIFTLLSIGSDLSSIKKIFFTEGLLITMTGGIIGIFLGGLISYAQQHFGIVTFPSDGYYIVDAYPVDVKTIDFVITFISVTLIGSIISLYPASRIKSKLTIQV